MSSIGDVVRDASALVVEFRRLLETETALQAPEIAAALNAQPQLDAAMQGAGAVVRGVADWAGRAWEIATVADAAVAVFGLLPVMADGIGAILRGAGDDIASLGPGLERLRDAGDQMDGAFRDVAGALQVGVDGAEAALAFLDPAAFRRLQSALADLAGRIAAFGKPAVAAGVRPAPGIL